VKVLLVNPPDAELITSETPVHVSRETGRFPPLGLLYVAAWLRRSARHEVQVIDMPARGLTVSDLSRVVGEERPGLVGITCITHNLVSVVAVAEAVKQADPSIVVCLGGPHVDAFPEESVCLPPVDYAIAGEGERSMEGLVDALALGLSPEDVPGLSYEQDGTIVMTAPPRAEQNLDDLPLPARDLVNSTDYYYVLGKRATFATMISSRGCPFKCTFCSTNHEKYRARTPNKVVDEMLLCQAAGVEEIHFVDDTFNLGRGRLADLAQAILDRGLKVKWSFRGRADGIDDSGMRLAAEAGCVRFHLGVETGTNRGLELLGKQSTIEQMEQAVGLGRRYGIASAAYFIIGCPHEKTAADIMHSIRFALRLDPDYAMFNILAIYPRTPLYEQAVGMGLLDPEIWKRFALDPRADFVVPLWEEHLDREELFHLLMLAYRRFYLRPVPIWRNLRSIGSLSEFMRKVDAGLSILLGRS
jgi:radical SAM superfamily enzyme YgiQ (UPF0313 family)